MCNFCIILLIGNLDEEDIQKNFCFSPKRSVPLGGKFKGKQEGRKNGERFGMGRRFPEDIIIGS